MALSPATRSAVITRRGHARTGLAQSTREAAEWMNDAAAYRGGSPLDRAIVAISRDSESPRPRIRIRRGTPYERIHDWLGAPRSPGDPRHPRREAALQRLPPGSAGRTVIALRTAVLVTLAGAAEESGGLLDGYLRLLAAGEGTSAADVALVVHVADRLGPWVAVSPRGRRPRTLLNPGAARPPPAGSRPETAPPDDNPTTRETGQ